MATLNQLRRTTKRPYRRVGRGQSSTRGKTSGRGTKGQSARSGNKKRPELRDIIKKLPKRRGFGMNRSRTVNPNRPQPLSVPLSRIERAFESGASVTPATLRAKGVLPSRSRHVVKIIGHRTSKAFSISGCRLSPSAREAIERAGGSVAQ